MVERDIDRSPQHADEWEVVWEMIRIKASLDLKDGWRDTHEEDIDFTWHGNTNERMGNRENRQKH
ncbi:hypothetical protein M408DRAFT_333756, partial [Serendipita vermifera MAFF 305830]